jgi:D-alanine--poly(phosphoribitol) ligase subunit 1
MESLFTRIAAMRGLDRNAVVGDAGALTWAELLDRAHVLARRLGPGPAPVLLYGHKEPAMVVGVVAALERARPYVPVDPTAPPVRIARMLDAARPTDAVLTSAAPAALGHALAARDIRTITLDRLAIDAVAGSTGGTIPAPVSVDPETLAYILFTSGTTGQPKGVPVPHRALLHFVDWLLATHGFVPGGEVFLNQAPFSFDLSVMDLYGALATGGTLFTLGRDELADARRLFRRLDGAPLTVWVSTPSFARLCLAEPRFGRGMLPALRRFLFCGETLPVGVARELLARFPGAQVWNMYGPTETTVAVTAVRVTEAMVAAERPLPVGHPAPGIDVWIADPGDPLHRLPDGRRGEIVIAGPQVVDGYLPPGGVPAGDRGASPFLTLADGRRAYRTGDLGSIDPDDGSLGCAGRLDRQIKLHGYRVELEEIEAILRAVPGVADGAVLVVERDGRPDHLVAVVAGDPAVGGTLPDGGRPLTDLVRRVLAESLPVYALPRIARRVPRLPLTANGKVDRPALRELLG